MSNQYYLHFTLGPVQGFVSQARRTRDFWAGSFLLSWLTAKAMAAVQDADGKVVMPAVEDDDLLKRVKATSGQGPNIGSLPNNFIAQVPENFDGDIVVQAVQTAWKDLAKAVSEFDKLEDAGVNPDLWNEQIESFWDMAWVLADSDDAAVLAMRKNWRTYMPPKSQGDKCTMMGEWQELSGAVRPKPKEQKKFWEKFKPFGTMDLRDNERLCAIAYVKRRFVHVWQKLEGHDGWKLPTSVPSTSYMAAVHWLEKLIQAQPDNEQVQKFVKLAGLGEKLTRIRCISEALKEVPEHVKTLADVDGRALFGSDKKEDEKINDARKSILKSVPNFDVPLSPFYAILMMDGDNLGKTKEAMGDATALSEALASFTSEVPDIVKNNHGFLIYAGGDDVLAILPLEDALPCAETCRSAYMDIFKAKGLKDGDYSISAAVEYAHMKLPLTMILKDAHRLLDDVAKDKTGRDAVACRVWKPGGEQQTWAMPWEEALDGNNLIIVQLAEKLGEDEQGDAGYASKLLYNIRETLALLQGASDIGHEDMVKLLVADYISSGLLDKIKEKTKKLEKADSLIRPLLEQCKVFENKQDTGKLSADAALLLRFLAQKGVER